MPTGKVAIGENYELDYDSHLDGAEIVSFAPNRTEIIAFVRNLNPDWPSDGKEIREVRRFHNPGSAFVGRIQWLQGELISDYQLNSPFRSFFSLLGGITIAAFAKHRFSIILSAVLLCGSIFILVNSIYVGVFVSLYVLYLAALSSGLYFGNKVVSDPSMSP